MEKLKNSTRILTRIDNIAYIISSDRSVSFCCLIKKCDFKSKDFLSFLYHVKGHSLEWSGYCHTCKNQIHINQVQFIAEYKHMTRVHLNNAFDNGRNAKPASIKVKLLSGDKLSKSFQLKRAGKYEKLNGSSTPSISLPTQSKKTFSKPIREDFWAKSTKSDSQSLIVANYDVAQVSVNVNQLKEHLVPSSFPSTGAQSNFFKQGQIVSVNESNREYDDSEIVSLKEWRPKKTHKTQANCKRMLRYISLYALYKCMDVNCAFTTDSADNMLIHLRNHENSAVHMDNLPSWLECAYCDVVADSCSLLVKHVQDEHKSSIFQCPHCFYRSCAAYNVVVHLNQFHPSEKMLVLVCNGKTKMFSSEKALIEKARGENLRPLQCEEGEACNRTFYVMDYFVKHMRSSSTHRDRFKCSFCGFDTQISKTARHLLVHSVGIYECVYCRFGVNDVKRIQNHMCNAHPSKLLYICVRLARKGEVLTDDKISSVASTLIAHLGQTVDHKIFQKCPFTHQQLSYMNPSLESNLKITDTSLVLTSVPAEHNQRSPTGETEITTVACTSNEANVNTEATSKAGLELSDVLSYKDLEKYYISDDFDKYFETLTFPQLPLTSPQLPLTSSQLPLTSRRKTFKESTLSTPLPDLLQIKMDNAAYHLATRAGLEGRKLYRCGFANCYNDSSDLLEFNVHLLQHIQSKNGFKCYHCHAVFRNIAGLKLHIQIHGIHRYFCYLCSYSSATLKDIHAHIRAKHKRLKVVKVPLNPKKHRPNKDMFVMWSESCQFDMNNFAIKLIERYENDFGVNALNSIPCISSEADKIQLEPPLTQESHIFVCNALNCRYRNFNENMLRLHLTTLHAEEEHYKCPHCDALICQKMDADKIISHLRMHKSKINERSEGIFADHGELNIEKDRHVVDRETLDETISKTRDEKKISKWQCQLCNDVFSKQKLVEVHIQTVHGKTFQYQCGICSELVSTTIRNIQEHISLRHPNVVSRIKSYYKKIECASDSRVGNNDPHQLQDYADKMENVSDKRVNATETIGESCTVGHLEISNNQPETNCSNSIVSDKNTTKNILTSTGNLLISKSQTTDENQMKSKLSDNLSYACYHCNFKSQNLTTTYNHWEGNHRFGKFSTNATNCFEPIQFPGLPFMFRILKILQCCYVRKRCFRDFKVRNEKYHPREMVAMVDNANLDRCGFNHFNELHKNVTTGALIEPDNFLTDELLDEIIVLRPRKVYECIRDFSSMTDLSVHTKEKDPKITKKFVSVPNDSVIYGCSKCEKTDSNESSMVAHIREHFHPFKCKFCLKQFSRIETVRHNCRDKNYRHIEVTENLDEYLAMKMIFPNGLVLTKREAKSTRYGAMAGVIKLVTEINHDLKLKRKSNDENENSASDSDDSFSTDAGLSLSSKVHPKKRWKLNADNVIQISPISTDKENNFPTNMVNA